MSSIETADILRKKAWGHMHSDLNYSEALNKFSQASIIYRKDKQWPKLFQTLKGIMYCESVLGNNEGAINAGIQGVELLKNKHADIDRIAIVKFYHNYSISLSKNEDYKSAYSFLKKALKKLSSARNKSEKRLLGNLYQGLGNTLMNLGNFKDSIEAFNSAIDINEDKYSLLYLTEQKASCLHKMGKYRESITLLKQVIRKRNKLGIPRDWAYFHLASSSHALGKKKEAFRNYAEALKYTDSLISNVTETFHRKSFFKQKLIIYERLIELALELGKYEDAYYYTRECKGKIFREEILKSKHSFKEFPELRKEKALRQEMKRLSLEDSFNPDEYKNLEQQHLDIINKLEKNKAKDIIFGKPLTLKQIKNILRSKDALIEFYTLPDITAIFLTTKLNFKVFLINISQTEIDKYVSIITKLIVQNNKVSNDTLSWYTVDFYNHLLQDVFCELKNIKHIIFSPHGILHRLPFNAVKNNVGEYIQDNYTISYIPSPLALKQVRPRKKPITQVSFLGIADSLNDLPGSITEVNSISRFFSKKKILKKGNAVYPKIVKELPLHSHIHIACHSKFNQEAPLKSYINLFPPADNIDRLTAEEIIDMDLRNVNSIILSCCSTALGSLETGDDMEGLARSLLIAGCKTVIVALWDIPDTQTSFFMEHFYKELLKTKSPSKALQHASLACSKEFKYPFNWAAFKLIGKH